MFVSIITEQPIWFIIFCILLGIVYATVLYRKDTKLEDLKPYIKSLMYGLRFLSVSLIAFLLLSPLVRNISKTIEKPIIILAQDNSESLQSYAGTSYLQDLKLLKSKLSEKFELKNLAYGSSVREYAEPDFTDKETDISELIDESLNKYYNRNIGALIIAGDGIYNKGSNPIYAVEDINFPIYTLALGDTSVRQDAAIVGVNHNKIAFLNNEFPVQIIVSAKKMKGKSAVLKISKNGKTVKSELINYNSDDFFKKLNFILKADKTGVQKYTVNLQYIDNEHSKINNRREIIIEVIDSKQKILILSGITHPDVGAVRRALETNSNFEIDYFPASKFRGNIADYNLLIAYQLQTAGNPATAIMQKVRQNEIPVLYILGSKTKLTYFNNLNTGVNIKHISGSYNLVQGRFNKNFSLFELNPNIASLSRNAPPLKIPFGDISLKSNSDILAYQTIKNIETEKPLIVLNAASEGKSSKSAVILGEGIWQWAVQDYRENKNHSLFNELINKLVQYLTLKANKDRFRVNCPKVISENEDVKFSAEIYNSSYEAVNNERISLIVKDSIGTKFEYEFGKTAKAYQLNIGKYKAGKYKWTAKTTIDGKLKTKSGFFNIAEINIEAENVTANHNILMQLSRTTGGNLFYENELLQLYDTISENPNIKPVSFTEKKTESLLNNKLLFFLILLLLSSEWFMRKYHGTI